MIAEALKHRLNRGNQANLSFFRDAKGLECDLLYPTERGIAFEVKSGSTISSDYFNSLHRVANVLPNITSKTVVHGGMDRQTRSDNTEAIPLDALSGVLEMLEVNREIAAFVDAHKGSAPDSDDVEALKIAYARYIRPTLDGLEPTLSPLAQALFRHFGQQSYVRFGSVNTNSSSLLERRHWERFVEETIIKDGFSLSGDRPLHVTHNYTFSDYIGKGRSGFDVNFSIRWRLDGERLSRSVTVNEFEVPELEVSISYAELALRATGEDQVVAEIGGRIIRKIGELAADSDVVSPQ